MRSITQLKGLGDMRTIVSTHARSTPSHKGTAYLQILSLGIEGQRLRAELAILSKRQGRILGRLGEIREAINGLADKVKDDGAPLFPSTAAGTGEDPVPEGASPHQPRWKRMTVGY